jgi:thiamine-phosphate pyrophosphorylase
LHKAWRIVDVEYNRVTEGLRVLEDLARFYGENEPATQGLKTLRAQLAGLFRAYRTELLANRDAAHDLGLAVSQTLQLDSRQSWRDLVGANCKRVQEGLRSLEEHLKILGLYPEAKKVERARFQAYSLEKDVEGMLSGTRKRRWLETDLYGITAAEYSRGRSNVAVVRQMLAAGIKAIQYREKERKLGEQYRECLEIRELTRDYDACFIVNDHLDLALAVGADGVHLGQDDLPVEQARRLAGAQMLIGLSTHSPEQAQAAVRAGADYIGVGPIFKTATKKDVCDPVGLGYLDYVAAHHSIGQVAIGGIKETNVAEVVRHGARCIALVTEIVGAPDIGAKIRAIRAEIKKVKEQMK